MMQCLTCGASMETRRENYAYTASGLAHITLQQVEVSRCPACGEWEVAIPHIEALHQAIATAIVQQQARLAPADIRYLRTYLGWSGAECAAHLGVTPETISRWERGVTAIGGQAERLLRVLVAYLGAIPTEAVIPLPDSVEAAEAPRLDLAWQPETNEWHVVIREEVSALA